MPLVGVRRPPPEGTGLPGLAALAQLVEHIIRNDGVACSSHASGTTQHIADRALIGTGQAVVAVVGVARQQAKARLVALSPAHFGLHPAERLEQESEPVAGLDGQARRDPAREAITRLREIGVKVYLDDFGTCYSSLSYLQHFELDALKLDKSFLRNISDRKKATQVIKSMIDFGHSLDMRVVVEGVESDWQARLLQLLGCDLLQGYALGAPVPLEQIQALRERPGSPLPVAGAEDAEPSGLRASSKAP